jgi:membrane-associated phospholipid phosphatase
MEKSVAKIISYLFHPLVMTTLGMLILFNSGTSLAVLQPEVKRLSLIVTALFTFVFPASMIIILYLMGVIHNIELHERKERVLPVALTIILYLFTFFVMRGIPQLAGGHIVFLFCPPVTLFIVLAVNNFMKPSIHMAGCGVVVGLLLVTGLIYGAAIQYLFIIAVLVGGLVGSARLKLGIHQPREIFTGFMIGLVATLGIMAVYIF